MIVVADTSVILNLCCVRQEHLLLALFREVSIPEEVRSEFERLSKQQPRFQGLRVPSWLKVMSVDAVPDSIAVMPNLHAGETAALALAMQLEAQAVLMDESAGRKAAHLLGMQAIGVLGVLMQAKRSGLLSAIKPVLDDLENQAGFWLAPALAEAALEKLGEA